MKLKYDSSYACRKISHITLQKPFRLDQQKSENFKVLQSALNSVARRHQPFKVYLSGFGHFGSNVLFVNIEPTDPLLSLRNDIRSELKDQKQLQFDKKRLGRSSFSPHITIANRDLTKENFNRAWPILKNRTFEHSFSCNCFWLLKHNTKEWIPDNKYSLKP